MKIIIIFFVALSLSSHASADDEYSDRVYTGTVILYWCSFNEIPRNIEDLSKASNIEDPNPKLTLPLEKWFQSVQFQVVGKELQVIRKFEREGALSTAKAISNCKSLKVDE